MNKQMAMHERIRVHLESLIMSGKLGPGERLPVEHQLMARFECSRMTVSKAITALNAAGLVERRKKAGTFVTRPRTQSVLLEIPDLQSEVRSRGGLYCFRQLKRSIRPVRKHREAEVKLAAGGLLLAIQGVHVVDGRPLALERRTISLTAVPEIAEVDFSETSPGTWLLQHIPWTEAETRVSAVNASRKEAELLEVETGAACLVVERSTWRQDRGVTDVKQTFVGSAYDMVARFSPARSFKTEANCPVSPPIAHAVLPISLMLEPGAKRSMSIERCRATGSVPGKVFRAGSSLA